MTVNFVNYNQINEMVTVGVSDRGDYRKINFTYNALQEELSDPDPSMSDNMKKILSLIKDKGGMQWIDKEIKDFRIGLIEGDVENLPARL